MCLNQLMKKGVEYFEEFDKYDAVCRNGGRMHRCTGTGKG